MHSKFWSINAFMAPQLQQTVCENTSNATSDAASCFVDTDFILMVTVLQFLIILTELKTM